jgi:polysaccharide export outer membrane protein
MKIASLVFLIACCSRSALTQETGVGLREMPVHNLPAQKIGPNDLLSVSVHDAPEMTRTFRVDSDGTISLPLLRKPVVAAGLMPAELEKQIAAALISNELLVEPIVKVSVAEYYSRPVSVAGAVKTPVTFQAHGNVTLLEAITRAGGLTEVAAGEVLVTIPGEPLPIRVPVRRLIDAADPAANLKLAGGEEVRVPEAARIFVAGNVRKPGAVIVRDHDKLTVLKMVALAEGLAPFAAKQAYVYRAGGEGTQKTEITVELEKILKRQTPDVALEPNDLLYVPDNSRRRAGMTVLDRIVLFGSTAGATALIWRGAR